MTRHKHSCGHVHDCDGPDQPTVATLADVLEDWYPGARRVHEDAADALLRTVVGPIAQEAAKKALRDAAIEARGTDLAYSPVYADWLDRRAEEA